MTKQFSRRLLPVLTTMRVIFVALSLALAVCSSNHTIIIAGGLQEDDSDTSTEWGRLPPATPSAAQQCHDANDDSSQQYKEEEESIEVAVIGGGLAGLAVAIGLHRASIPFKLYERAPALRDTSQGGLSVWANGLAALRRIHPDLPDKVAAAGAIWKGSMVTDVFANGTTNEKYHDASEPKDKKAQHEENSVLIAWHELQKVLASMLPSESVVVGKSLMTFTETTSDGVLLRFEDGTRVRCRAALACDGVFSAARRIICPEDDDKPVFFGHMNWNAIVSTKDLPENSHPPNNVRVVRYHDDPRWFTYMMDVGKNRTFFSCRVEDPEKALSVSGSRGRGGLGLNGVKARLLPIVSGHSGVHDALEAIPESMIFERCIVVRVSARTWISPGGRVALVGDAAHGMHPIIGQGGNSALESSAAAVEALTKCGGDYNKGLREYEDKRKPRADFVQQFSNLAGCAWGPSQSPLPADVLRLSNEYARSTTGASEAPPCLAVEALESFDLRNLKGVELIE